MNQKISFDYYYGMEAEQFSFYRIPKILFTSDIFKELSSDAKILYGLMLDRMSLSIQNKWFDKDDRAYIIFTLEEVMVYMNCGKDKGVKIMAELDSNKGIGLIERVKQGLGRPALIYVKNFVIKDSEDCNENEVEEKQGENSRSQDFGKVEVKTSEKPKSGVLKNRSQEFGKTDSNYTNINKTNINNNNSIYLSGYDGEIEDYDQIIKENIEYDVLVSENPFDKQYIDEIYEILVDAVSIPREQFRIQGANYPFEVVRNRLLKITSDHIYYILECLHQNNKKVKNIKSYLLTTLFNAPVTIGSFYQAKVNHDLSKSGGD